MLAFMHPNVQRNRGEIEESRRAMLEFCETVEFFPIWVKHSPVHFAAGIGLSTVSLRPFSMVAHRSEAFFQRTQQLMRGWTPDILHVDTLGLYPFVPPRPATATVLTHHNIESMLMRRRAQVEKCAIARSYLQLETTKLERWEAVAAPQVGVNITMSTNDAEELVRIAPRARTAVVANGVNTDYFTPQPAEETKAVIYAGGMNMFANRDAVMYFLADIWPLLTASVPDLRFFAVGKKPPPEVLAFAARDPRVIVTGYVEDVRPYVSKAAVYVVPIRVGGGTRVKVLDAMASGKAIVSTSVGCEGIRVTSGEELIVEDSPAGIAAATVALLTDDTRRRTLGAAARRRAEDTYSWSIVGQQLLKAYHLAIEHHAGKHE